MLGCEGLSVLLLDGGLQGISVSNSLKRFGCQVYVISKESLFKHCNFVKKVVNYPLSVNEVITFSNRELIRVIVPMSDKSAEWLSINKVQIEAQTNAKCAITDINTFRIAGSKSSLMALCQKNNIPIPRTVKLSSENLMQAGEYVGYPALIKPDHSVGARGITRVNSIEELLKYAPQVEQEYGKCSLQEFVDNKDFYYNVMLYRYSNGDFAQYVVTKIQRFYPLSGGSSSYCITVEEPKLVSICKKVLDILDWRGFADFDALYDKEEEEFKIIEINPRVPASVRAADISGVNFPQIIIADLLGLNRPIMSYEPGIVLRYFGLDVMWFLKSPKRFSVQPSWFKFFGKNLFYQDLYKEDKLMSLYTITEGISKIFKHR